MYRVRILDQAVASSWILCGETTLSDLIFLLYNTLYEALYTKIKNLLLSVI
jgi:hypothetical protein